MNLGTNIRIGNDIRLHVTIRKEWDENNIKQIRAYIINTSLRDEELNPWNHVMRFPRDPLSKFFRPGPHHLNRCGAPCYHCHPHDPNYVFDDGFHRPFWSCMDPHFYHGFGWEPGRFPHRWFGWTRRHDPGFGHRSPFDPIEVHLDSDFEYLAPSKVIDGKNRIVVYFPAKDQLACGAYKLVLVITTYEAGWGRDNLHTYTVDYGNLFNLVDDQSGIEGDVDYDADTHRLIPSSTNISDVKSGFGHYYIYEGDLLSLGSNDVRGRAYKLYCRVDGGDWVTYQNDWRYDDLQFESNDGNVVAVNADGTLYAQTYKEDNHETVIRFYTADKEVLGKFIVTVMDHVQTNGEIAATFSSSAYPTEIDPTQFKEVNSEFTLTNSDEPKYLWIRVLRPIKFVASDNNTVVTGVTSGGYIVPMQNYIKGESYYYYRSSGKVIAGDHTFKVEFGNE